MYVQRKQTMGINGLKPRYTVYGIILPIKKKKINRYTGCLAGYLCVVRWTLDHKMNQAENIPWNQMAVVLIIYEAIKR